MRHTRSTKAQRRRFGKLVRRYRRTCGLRQHELATALGLDQGLLSRIENGLRPPPWFTPYADQNPLLGCMAQVFGLRPGTPECETFFRLAQEGRFGRKRGIKLSNLQERLEEFLSRLRSRTERG